MTITMALTTPGRYADWFEYAFWRVCNAVVESQSLVPIEEFGALAEAMFERSLTRVLCVSRNPDLRMLRAAGRTTGRAIVGIAPLHNCGLDLMLDQKLSPAEAVRHLANIAARLSTAPPPAAVTVRLGPELGSRTLVEQIAKVLSLELPEGAEKILIEDSRLLDLEAHAKGPRDLDGSAAEDYAAALDGAVDQWIPEDSDARDPSAARRWDRRLFFEYELGRPLTETVDLTGPPRCAVFGPYIRLPVGSWSCVLNLTAHPDQSGLELLVESFAGAAVSRSRFSLKEAGRYELEFSFTVQDADAPVEIRIFNESAVFDGSLSLRDVRLKQIGQTRIYGLTCR